MTIFVSISWIAWLVLVPLMGAMLCFLFPRLVVWVGLGTGGTVSFCVAGLVAQVMQSGPQRHLVGAWGAPLGIELAADGLSAWLLAVTAVIGVSVSIYAAGYFADEPESDGQDVLRQRRFFWPLWLFLWAALNALFLSGDIFNLYVTLELLGFSAVALVALANTRDALTAAMRYLLAGMLGSLFFLMGVALLYGTYATLDLVLLAHVARPNPPTWVALTLITAGLLMKGAVFPLHSWLPPAHSSAPAPVSALLSALVVAAPFYILARMWFYSFASVTTTHVSFLLGALGTGALLWGATQALRQLRLKLLVAYSTVAQLGYLFLLFPLARDANAGFTAWSGCLYFVATHACAKTAMFLAAGNILRGSGHDEIARLNGLAERQPVSVFAFALAGISLVGLPPSGIFLAKWQLLNAAITLGQWWFVAVFVAGSILTISYVMRVVSRALAGPTEIRTVKRVPLVMEWTALALALVALIMGLAAAWPSALLRVGAPVAGPALLGGEP